MSIAPQGERVRSAVRWISEGLKTDPSRSVMSLVDEAGMRFDLTPKESTELAQFYRAAAEKANRPAE